MSEDVLNSDGPGDNQLSTGVRFGEIIVTQRRDIVLRCSFCSVEYRVYKNFLDHILAHYYAEKHIFAHHNADKAQQFEGTAKLQRSSQKGKQSYPEVELEIALEDHHFNEVQIKTETNVAHITPATKKDHVSVTAEELGDHHFNEVQIENETYVAHITQALTKEHIAVTAEETATRMSPAMTDVDFNDSTKALSPLPIPKKNRIKSYKCETCDAIINNPSTFRSHILRHTGMKPYSCEHCEKKFYTSTECATHERRHTGERPFVCSSCGQRFFTCGTLTKHERRHIGHRPCKCEICDKEFFDSTRLKAHLVVHTGERKHVCTVCNSTFAHLRSMKTHMKLHANAREYQCNLCDMAFNQLPALLMHKKNKHKVILNNTSYLKDDIVSASESKTKSNKCK